MKNNIMISLVSIQFQDGEKTESELLTKGFMKKAGDDIVISYEDTEMTGFEGCVTTIRIKGNKSASVVRTGAVSSALILDTGKKNFCQYGTPFGIMQIGVYTHRISNTLEKDGRLYMKYSLDLNASFLSDNEIILSVKDI